MFLPSIFSGRLISLWGAWPSIAALGFAIYFIWGGLFCLTSSMIHLFRNDVHHWHHGGWDRLEYQFRRSVRINGPKQIENDCLLKPGITRSTSIRFWMRIFNWLCCFVCTVPCWITTYDVWTFLLNTTFTTTERRNVWVLFCFAWITLRYSYAHETLSFL